MKKGKMIFKSIAASLLTCVMSFALLSGCVSLNASNGGNTNPIDDIQNVRQVNIEFASENSVVLTEKANQNETYSAPTAAKVGINKVGYDFMGWATVEGATKATYLPGDNIPVSDANLRLYAVWRMIDDIVVADGDTLFNVVGGYTLTMVKGYPKGQELYDMVLGGITATFIDDENDIDITEEIFIKSINENEEMNLDEIAAQVGTLNVEIAVPDYNYSKRERVVTLTRTVDLVSKPTIRFNGNRFDMIDNETVSVKKNAEIDLLGAVIFEADESHPELTKNDIQVRVNGVPWTGVFVPQEVTTYIVNYRIMNKHGYGDNVTIYLQVLTPTPIMGMMPGNSANFATGRTSGENLQSTLLDGIFAQDGEGNDVTTGVVIDSVNGVSVNDINWDETADTLGDFTVGLKVTNAYKKSATMTRVVKIVDTTTILFDDSQFAWESGRIRIFLGEEFDFQSALSIYDGSDFDLTVDDIVITSDVDTEVVGLYTITFEATNKYGMSAPKHTYQVVVRLKTIMDFTAFELYDRIQYELSNSYYETKGDSGYSFDGGGMWYVKGGFRAYTSTKNTPDMFSHTEYRSGWVYLPSGYIDLNRANVFSWDKNSNSATLQNTEQPNRTGGLFGGGRNEYWRNSAWDVYSWQTANAFDVIGGGYDGAQGFVNYYDRFGRVAVQDEDGTVRFLDGNYLVNEQTANATLSINSDGTYTISFDMIINDESRSSAGVKGRFDYIEKLHATRAMDKAYYARLTYVFDANYQVKTKRIEEKYDMKADDAAVWGQITYDMTEEYTYSANNTL